MSRPYADFRRSLIDVAAVWEADQASRRLAQLAREGLYEEALQQRLDLRNAMAEEKVLVGKFERQFARWKRVREEAHDSRTK